MMSVAGAGHAVESRQLTVVTLGDSLTAGTPYFRSPLEAPPDGAGDPDAYYGTWVMRKHPEWRLVNQGIAGQRSAEIRDRLERALSQKPDYVILLAGTNDIYQGIDLGLTTRNLAGMYREMKRRGIVPIAATLPPFDTATPQQAAQVRQLNEWILRNAERLGVPQVDFYAAVTDRTQPDRLDGTSDGVHPDIGGYRRMGLAALRVLEKLEESPVLKRSAAP